MKKFNYMYFILWIALIIGGCSSENVDEKPNPKPDPTLTVTPSSFSFLAEGGVEVMEIASNTTWRINFESTDWCKPSIQTGMGNANVSFTTDANPLGEIRNLSYTISAEGLDSITLGFIQAAGDINPPDPEPEDSIAPDNTGMSSDALVLASKMYVGWNLGNSLEATGGETAWGNPKTTEDFIKAVRDAGFNTIRLPCSWDHYLEDQTTYTIKTSWLLRVKEVVDYCVNNDVYVMLNIHWDGGWLEENCTQDKQEEVNKKQAAIWKQIAIAFRDYDEHLLFAGANEPNVDNQEQMDVLSSYLQTFVDVVRSTGGRNAYRNLIVQGPRTDIEKTYEWMKMPTDNIENRLMAEVHYYTPWQFCGLTQDAGWGKMYYFWGKDYHLDGADGRYPDWDCEEDYVLGAFQKMKTKFVDKGIPVILGEYGVIRRIIPNNSEWQEKHSESRAYFNQYITKQAKNYGLVPVYWDEGSLQENGFGFMNRNLNAVGDQEVYDGIIKGASEGKYPY